MSRRWGKRFLFLGTLLAVVCPALAERPSELVPGQSVEARLAEDETHRHLVALPPGVWEVYAEQVGIDVVLEAAPAAGGERLRTDLPFDRRGRERLLLEPREATAYEVTAYEIVVQARETGVPAGRYRLGVADLRGMPPRRLEARRAAAAAGIASARRDREGWRAAVERFEAALALEEEPFERAWLLHALGLVHRQLGEYPQAAQRLAASLELWRSAGAEATGEAAAATCLNDLALTRWDLGETAEAERLLALALLRFRSLNRPYDLAVTHNNLCLLRHARADLSAALDCYRQVLASVEGTAERRLEALLRNNLAGVHDRLGQAAEARRQLLAALTLRQALGDRRGEAETLNNLASLDRYTGRWRDALARWGRALELFRALEDGRREAVTLNNLGSVYLRLGDAERARELLLEALTRRRAAGDRRGEAITLNHLASVHRLLGETAAADVFRLEALEQRRGLGDRTGEARMLTWLGRDALESGKGAAALERFEAALAIFGQVEDPRNAVLARSGRGRALGLLGRPEAAPELERALAEHRTLGDEAGQVDTRVALAVVQRQRGRPEAALAHAEAAVAGVEALRGGIANPDLASSFLAVQRQAYEFATDLLVDAGRPADALAMSERARARGLLALLAEAEIDPRQGVAPELRVRRRELIERLYLEARQEDGPAAEQRARRLTTLAELDRLEAEIRRANPAYAALTAPQPLDAGGIQALLDEGTTLLQYSLGQERSLLWRVTRESLEVYSLPPRSEIEAVARQAHRRLITLVVTRREEGAADPLVRLGELVLGPVAGKLLKGKTQRLVIAADGALHYVPFAALPLPAAGGEPLVEGFDVVHVPSLSVLAVQRRTRRGQATSTAVVVADPIFDAADPRIEGKAGRETAAPFYGRLPATRHEAQALLDLLAPGQGRALLDEAASRQAVLDGALAEAGLVHLATHGVIDDARPHLSGLLLSRFDRHGRPLEGFLGLADLFELRLAARLVVLSGCRTALGKEVRGEGLVGLTRGFFHAGTPRVIASLWPVEDQATAELMQRFYRALLSEGRSPAAALAGAQRQVRAERRWRDPHHWAAFVLQGDWR